MPGTTMMKYGGHVCCAEVSLGPPTSRVLVHGRAGGDSVVALDNSRASSRTRTRCTAYKPVVEQAPLRTTRTLAPTRLVCTFRDRTYLARCGLCSLLREMMPQGILSNVTLSQEMEPPRGYTDAPCDSRLSWWWFKIGGRATYRRLIYAVREFVHGARAARKMLNAQNLRVELKVRFEHIPHLAHTECPNPLPLLERPSAPTLETGSERLVASRAPS